MRCKRPEHSVAQPSLGVYRRVADVLVAETFRESGVRKPVAREFGTHEFSAQDHPR